MNVKLFKEYYDYLEALEKWCASLEKDVDELKKMLDEEEKLYHISRETKSYIKRN